MPRLDDRAIAIARACDTLLPLVRTARQVLKRHRSMSAAELVSRIRLDAWAAVHGHGARAEDVANAIANKNTAYAIVRQLSGTRRTSDQVKAVYLAWRGRQTREASRFS